MARVQMERHQRLHSGHSTKSEKAPRGLAGGEPGSAPGGCACGGERWFPRCLDLDLVNVDAPGTAIIAGVFQAGFTTDHCLACSDAVHFQDALHWLAALWAPGCLGVFGSHKPITVIGVRGSARVQTSYVTRWWFSLGE